MRKSAIASMAIAIAVQCAVSAHAQDKVPGAVEYLTSCASCHGVDGRGAGPVVPYLSVKVPDITRLSERNKGHFPFTQVFMIIDGRTQLRGHGTDEMPVFGQRYRQQVDPKGTNPIGAEQIVRGRILELVNYLESIQVGAGKERVIR